MRRQGDSIYFEVDTHLSYFREPHDDAEIYLTHCSRVTANCVALVRAANREEISFPRETKKLIPLSSAGRIERKKRTMSLYFFYYGGSTLYRSDNIL